MGQTISAPAKLLENYPAFIRPTVENFENPSNKEILGDIRTAFKKNHFAKPSKIYYLFLLFGLVVLLAGLISFAYVNNAVSVITNTSPLNTIVLNDSTVLTQLNVHYIVITDQQNKIISLTLPNPANIDVGTFVSVNAGSALPTNVQFNVRIGIAGRTNTITLIPSDNVTFLIALEGTIRKWKIVKSSTS
jgi:hypothetical protein